MKVLNTIALLLALSGCIAYAGTPFKDSSDEPVKGDYKLSVDSQLQPVVPEPFLIRNEKELKAFLAQVPAKHHSLLKADLSKLMWLVVVDDAHRSLGMVSQVEVFEDTATQKLQVLIYTLPDQEIDARSLDLGVFTAFLLSRSSLSPVWDFVDRTNSIAPEAVEDPVTEKWGIRFQGDWILEPRWSFAYPVTDFGVFFAVDESGWGLYDLDGQFLLKPFDYDNGPDYFSEDLARFVEKGKMGFFDPWGTKVIPAQFEFAQPFEGGQAVVARKVVYEQMDEYKIIKSAEYNTIDRQGNLLGQWEKGGSR